MNIQKGPTEARCVFGQLSIQWQKNIELIMESSKNKQLQLEQVTVPSARPQVVRPASGAHLSLPRYLGGWTGQEPILKEKYPLLVLFLNRQLI